MENYWEESVKTVRRNTSPLGWMMKDTIDWRRVLNSLTKQELVEIILAHEMELIE